jgi:hypothetical protein
MELNRVSKKKSDPLEPITMHSNLPEVMQFGCLQQKA